MTDNPVVVLCLGRTQLHSRHRIIAAYSHQHRPGRRGHHCSSARFGRGIGFSRSTDIDPFHVLALLAAATGSLFRPVLYYP
jgi:hypothetical protein